MFLKKTYQSPCQYGQGGITDGFEINIRRLFSIGEIAVLYRSSNNGNYDFSFRNHFDCHSIVSAVKQPVLLHIGAIEDYEAVSSTLNEI